jgi:hypothetical protein
MMGSTNKMGRFEWRRGLLNGENRVWVSASCGCSRGTSFWGMAFPFPLNRLVRSKPALFITRSVKPLPDAAGRHAAQAATYSPQPQAHTPVS